MAGLAGPSADDLRPLRVECPLALLTRARCTQLARATAASCTRATKLRPSKTEAQTSAGHEVADAPAQTQASITHPVRLGRSAIVIVVRSRPPRVSRSAST